MYEENTNRSKEQSPPKNCSTTGHKTGSPVLHPSHNKIVGQNTSKEQEARQKCKHNWQWQ